MPQEATTSSQPEGSASQSDVRGAMFNRKREKLIHTLVAGYNDLSLLSQGYEHTEAENKALELTRLGIRGLVLTTIHRAHVDLMNLYIENSRENAEVMCMNILAQGLNDITESTDEPSAPKATGKPFGMTSAALGLPEDWKDKLAKVTYKEVMQPVHLMVFPLNFLWSNTFSLSVMRNRPFILKNHPEVLQVAQLSIDQELEYYCHMTTAWVKFLPHQGIDIGNGELLLIKAPHVKGYLFLHSRFRERVVGDEDEEAWNADR